MHNYTTAAQEAASLAHHLMDSLQRFPPSADPPPHLGVGVRASEVTALMKTYKTNLTLAKANAVKFVRRAAPPPLRMIYRTPPESEPYLEFRQGEADDSWMQLPPGEDPPFVQLEKGSAAVTMSATITLFKLTEDQAVPFVRLCDTLHAELALSPAERLQRRKPLRMLVQGEAGEGKSRMILAFLWYALQHGGNELVSVSAYTWRAALQVGK